MRILFFYFLSVVRRKRGEEEGEGFWVFTKLKKFFSPFLSNQRVFSLSFKVIYRLRFRKICFKNIFFGTFLKFKFGFN